jgi:quinoprotein glucose dehydrogenase
MIFRIDRRKALATTSAFSLVAAAFGVQTQVGAQPAPAAPVPPAIPPIPDAEWRVSAGDLANARHSPLDQINASNFNQLEVAWRFKTDNYGPRKDAYFNASPIMVKGRLYAPVGWDRYMVCLDAATGQLIWSYRHDEKDRMGARGGSGWGASYWTDGTEERILFVTRSYQLVSLDAKTGRPDPKFGDGTEVDLRKDWDREVNPTAAVVGLHAPPCVVKDTVVIGNASSSQGPGHVRGYDVRTGKRKWIFHTVPQKGEFGYDTWLVPGQAERATNTGVWAPITADPELGLIYAGVELPQADWLGTSRHGNALFTESLVCLDAETGQRKWHYQTEHHGLWDRDIASAAILCDIPMPGGKIVKAVALPTKQAFLFVFDRVSGRPLWPIEERKVEAGDIPGEWYAPTQPFPTKPPPFDRQGFTLNDAIDWTPEIKARATALVSKYKLGPIYTPPTLVKEDGTWGTLTTPENQGGANWSGGSYDPETGIFYVYSKSVPQIYGHTLLPDGRLGGGGGTGRGTNDNMGGSFGGSAEPTPRSGNGGPVENIKDGLNDPITRGLLTINGLSILKPPYGRITAIDLKTGNQLWQVAHGETPDFIRNNPLLKGVTIPRTGQAGILGVMTTKNLVICGDAGLFTDERGRKAARLRAYDKMTGREVGAVLMDQAQTGSPASYAVGGRQYIVVASGGFQGAEFIAYRLPVPQPAFGGRGGRGGRGPGPGGPGAGPAPGGRGAGASGGD